VVDLVVETEDDVFRAIRQFLSYLPTRAGERTPRVAPLADDQPSRRAEELLEIVPRDRRRLYDMRRLLALVLDLGSFFEISPTYGRSQITGLGRLDGHAAGVFANDPTFQGGAMGAEGAQKVRRFFALCQTFHLPILSFVDEPGFMIGSQAEAAGTIRYGVEAICAAVETTVPWATVHVRKAYGVASAAHFGPGGHVLAWPSAESGPLPIEGGVAVAFKREIAAAPNPEAKRRELEESFAKGRSAFPRAEAFSVHDLIDPRDTRGELCRWLELALPHLEREARRRSLE
jgi:acetyl-CoA carboxylase carboxyltransferase component